VRFFLWTLVFRDSFSRTVLLANIAARAVAVARGLCAGRTARVQPVCRQLFLHYFFRHELVRFDIFQSDTRAIFFQFALDDISAARCRGESTVAFTEKTFAPPG